VLGGEEEEEEVCARGPDPPGTLCRRLMVGEDSRGGDGSGWPCWRGPGCSEMLLRLKELQSTPQMRPSSRPRSRSPGKGDLWSRLQTWVAATCDRPQSAPQLLLLGRARGSSGRSLSWVKYLKVACWLRQPLFRRDLAGESARERGRGLLPG